jgi:hypothetical protein
VRLIDADALSVALGALRPDYALSAEEEGRCNGLRDVLEVLDAAPSMCCKDLPHDGPEGRNRERRAYLEWRYRALRAEWMLDYALLNMNLDVADLDAHWEARDE